MCCWAASSLVACIRVREVLKEGSMATIGLKLDTIAYRQLLLNDCRLVGTGVGACRIANEKALLHATLFSRYAWTFQDDFCLFVSSNYLYSVGTTTLSHPNPTNLN